MKFQNGAVGHCNQESPPVWGAWVEIAWPQSPCAAAWSPPVWGAWVEICMGNRDGWGAGVSPPVWGAWVEMVKESSASMAVARRPPCGGRGLKL